MICMYTSKFEFPVHRFFRNNSFYYISTISCKERKSAIPSRSGDVLIKTVNKKSIRSDDQTPFCHLATIRRWEHTKTNFSTGFVTIYYTFDFLESEDSSLFYNPLYDRHISKVMFVYIPSLPFSLSWRLSPLIQRQYNEHYTSLVNPFYTAIFTIVYVTAVEAHWIRSAALMIW